MFFAACGGENKVPIEVSVSERHNPILHRYVKYLSITSLVDSVKLPILFQIEGSVKLADCWIKIRQKLIKFYLMEKLGIIFHLLVVIKF